MTKEPRFPRILLAGLVGLAAGGCGDPESPGSGTGGAPGSGGSTRGGAGGSVTGGAGASPSAGQSGRGGSTGLAGGAGAGASTPMGGSGGVGGSAATGGAGAASSAGGAAGSAAADGGSMATSGASGGAGASGQGSGGLGGAGSGGATAAGTGGRGGGDPGTCIASKATGTNAKGSGPHAVVVETNSGAGIKEGTIFRPSDLGGAEKYPIFVWGQGACAQDGLANALAMAELASHGYFVVADGTPNGTGNRVMDRSNLAAMGAPLVAYIDWAIAENEKPCSAYYQSLETTKVASNGFSCGGLMSQATVTDPRIVTWGVNSSGMAGADQAFYDLIHTPVLFVEGGPDDIAYDGAREGYDAIAKLDVPVIWFSKNLGHGGDLFQTGGGDFNKINLAWLNWWLKGDETATGKGSLVGAGCSYCSDNAWEAESAHLP